MQNKALITLIIFSVQIFASNPLIQVNKNGYAINGYDPVAYFTLYKAIQGNKAYSVTYRNTTWLFVDEENKILFQKNPDKYIPKYGGYCAYGVKFGMKVRTDPRNFSIVNKKLYLNLNKKIKNRWEKRTEYNIKKADRKWPRVKDKRERD